MTTTSPGIGDKLAGSAESGRFARLVAQARALRTRAGSGSKDKWLLIGGGVLMPLGVVFILLGWLGASRTPLAFEQNDYLISGGVLGLALVISGGFVYFAYWQTVRIRESRQQAADLSGAVARLEALVAAGGLAAGGGGAAGSAAQTFVATANGSIYHRPDCQVVAARDDLEPVDPATTSLRPCRICEPVA